MKRLHWLTKIILLILFLLFIRSIMYDLSVGTASELITSSSKDETKKDKTVQKPDETENNAEENKENIETNQESPSEIRYTNYKVKAGDTVLSIAEELNKVNVPIQQLLDDFEKLNPGVNPHQIQIEETYNIPIYDKE